MKYNTTIKLIGVFFLLSGWVIVLASLTVLRRASPQAGFALAGGAVEAIGAALLFRAHGFVSGGGRR